MAADLSDDVEISGLRRVRAMALLVVLVVVLGAIAAGVLGLLIVVSTTVIDHALG